MLIHNVRIKLSNIQSMPLRAIECPKDACFISCALQNENIVVYYTTTGVTEKADFQICTLLTGVKFDNPASTTGVNFNFLGTVTQYSEEFYVVHVFTERMKECEQ